VAILIEANGAAELGRLRESQCVLFIGSQFSNLYTALVAHGAAGLGKLLPSFIT
jgi:hypothetical protein